MIYLWYFSFIDSPEKDKEEEERERKKYDKKKEKEKSGKENEEISDEEVIHILMCMLKNFLLCSFLIMSTLFFSSREYILKKGALSLVFTKYYFLFTLLWNFSVLIHIAILTLNYFISSICINQYISCVILL